MEPPPKNLQKKSFSITKNHRNVIFINEFFVIGTPPQGSVLHGITKRGGETQFILKNFMISLIPNKLKEILAAKFHRILALPVEL